PEPSAARVRPPPARFQRFACKGAAGALQGGLVCEAGEVVAQVADRRPALRTFGQPHPPLRRVNARGILTVQREPDQRLPPGEPVPPDRGRVLLPEHLSGRWRLEKWWGYAVAGHHQTDRIPHVQGHGELLIIPDGQRPGGDRKSVV